jgi:hypothetical protein
MQSAPSGIDIETASVHVPLEQVPFTQSVSASHSVRHSPRAHESPPAQSEAARHVSSASSEQTLAPSALTRQRRPASQSRDEVQSSRQRP